MTRKITLYWSLTPKEIIPPSITDRVRKDTWIQEMQRTVQSEWKPKTIRVTYELHNPEIDRQMAFFNGPVVEYYAIQAGDYLDELPDTAVIKRYREEMLDSELGYDMELINRTVRRRESTGDFKEVQKWHDFLQAVQENQFDAQGYEFPDSKKFEAREKKYGYEKAKSMAIRELQIRIKRKLSTDVEN